MITPLRGKQLQSVRLAKRRINLWEGSVRSGKSVASLIAFLEQVHTYPGIGVIGGKTEGTIERNVVVPLQQMIGKKRAKYTKGETLELLGSPFYIISGSNDLSYTRLQGVTTQTAYVDEATILPESYWKMLTTRLSLPNSRLFGTMNPGPPAHWMLREWLDRATVHLTMDGQVVNPGGDLDLARFTFGLDDNPALSEEYKANIRKEHAGMWHQRYVQGLWVAAIGAIWPNLEEQVWQGPVPEFIQYWIVSIDSGTTNPTAALLVGEDYEQRAFVIGEYYQDSRKTGSMTDAEHVRELQAWLMRCEDLKLGASRPGRVLIDPAAAHMYQALRRSGLPAFGADNTVVDGIRLIASMLTARRLWIMPHCENLRREGSSYVWDERAQDKGEDAPVKHNDHTCDALRYVANDRSNTWNRWLSVAA